MTVTKNQNSMTAEEECALLLRKLLIVQLGLAGVSQAQIREIAGGAMGEVSGIVKLLNKGNRNKRQQ